MKVRSTFFACLMITLGFATITGLAVHLEVSGISTFFGACTIVFLMMLPTCSIKN